MSGLREAKLLKRMEALGIQPSDVAEIFTRSSGPGGQNVNKTASAVVLVHKPTGLKVRCEQERSQTQNRVRAQELLLDKIEAERRRVEAARRSAVEKVRRRTRPRPWGVQQRVLEGKRRQGEKKRQRQYRGGE